MVKPDSATIPRVSRIASIDVLRGGIMILLAAESCLLYTSLKDQITSTLATGIIDQFFHHPWHGLRLWDLVQPGFMLIAGVALYASWKAKSEKGLSWTANGKTVFLRCLKLFFFGVALHCVYAGKLVWELWNVLTQLSVTTLIAFLIIRESHAVQLSISMLLLVSTEFLYRWCGPTGFDEPFQPQHNFGTYFDLLLMGKVNSDGWVAINFIPTAAHTIWGALCGRILLSEKRSKEKIQVLLVGSITGLILGYGLDFFSITPIIKRISTSSFVLVSGGWVLIAVAFCYWFVDVCDYRKYSWIFSVMGMNALFIYLFFETVGIQWLNRIVRIFVGGLAFLSISSFSIALISSILTLFIEWYLCYWLHKKKIFFKV
ncbi:acyltransferase family protein [Desertivirga arenae]|uniref:acyltransferase family protein n=1 Tax=Desertivirga arenae TaxID=2810309 RepID=UPI001A97C41B|nr:DUF5009 domain-containing protein [Pedobacter sp. SYSU D00823]